MPNLVFEKYRKICLARNGKHCSCYICRRENAFIMGTGYVSDILVYTGSDICGNVCIVNAYR